MEISIKWQQIYEELPTATTTTKRILLPKPVWNLFNMPDILTRSRNYAIELLRRSTLVVIKQGESIISNNMEMRNLYRKKGSRVYDLASLQPSDEAIQNVGFI